MRQDRQLRQQVVVCKMAAGEPAGAEVLRLPRLAPGLSCCLQDRPRRGRPAKPVRRNALGPELKCCLQVCRGGASGPGVAVAHGSVWPRRDSSAGTASSNVIGICGSAIFGDCRGRRRGIRDRRRSWPVIIGATTALADGFAADGLAPLELRRLEILLAVEATPFTHMNGVFSSRRTSCRLGQNLETAVEWLPRPRQWPHWLTTTPGKLRSFKPGMTLN